MSNAASQMFEANVRLEAVIYIPGAVVDPEATPEAFREFCEDLPDRVDAPLYAQLPDLKRYAGEGAIPEPEYVAERLLDQPGFLVQAATPVRGYGNDPADASFHWSWGHYYTAWLYAATEADIAPVAAAWAETRAAADLLKATGEKV